MITSVSTSIVLAADLVAVVAEDAPPIGRASEADARYVPNAASVPASGVDVGKNSLLKTSAAARAVEEEVVPLDRRADDARDRELRYRDVLARVLTRDRG